MNSSEILFLYDAKNSNPNGDMDNENKPRMDLDVKTNLVSDVRLKRYIRDYLHEVKKQEIFITSDAEKAEKRVKDILEKSSNLDLKDLNKLREELIDVRLFGAVFATKGGNDHFTGPIQFNWGYSLNKVDFQESNTITSSFSSGEGIGKDYRVIYSFLAFSGGINGKLAEKTLFSDDDLKMFDEAMIKAIPFCRTRSKIGQTPRLYLRVELKTNTATLKDLREYIHLQALTEETEIRTINDFEINIKNLINYLDTNESKISKINYWCDDNLKLNPTIPDKWEKIDN